MKGMSCSSERATASSGCSDNTAFAAGEPGIGTDAARWLTERKIVLVGSDTWATEVVPPEDPERPFPVHLMLLVPRWHL